MISETVFASYKEAVERLEKEKQELKKQIEAEQQKTNFAIYELEKNKLEMLVLKKENEALEEKLDEMVLRARHPKINRSALMRVAMEELEKRMK